VEELSPYHRASHSAPAPPSSLPPLAQPSLRSPTAALHREQKQGPRTCPSTAGLDEQVQENTQYTPSRLLFAPPSCCRHHHIAVLS
jgi:hypothetical protein